MSSKEMANELDRFRSDIALFEEAAGVIEKNWKNLIDEIRALDSMWTGPAHEAFVMQFSHDSEIIEEMIRCIKKIQGDLDYAYTEYSNCEKSVNEIVNSLKV